MNGEISCTACINYSKCCVKSGVIDCQYFKLNIEKMTIEELMEDFIDKVCSKYRTDSEGEKCNAFDFCSDLEFDDRTERCDEYKKWLEKKVIEQAKRIKELEKTGKELLIDAMHFYDNYYPNNFKRTKEEYFVEEIKVFKYS